MRMNAGLLMIMVALCGDGHATPAGRSPVDSSRNPPPEELVGYRIGPEDVLQISVWNNDAMSRTAPVRPDGKISLPLLNDVQAAGLTPMELREQLLKRLVDYMPHPEVAVMVSDVHSFKVAVIGQVPKPDRYELKSTATVIDLLAMAGGFTEFASRSRVVVIRSSSGKTVRIPFDYDKVREGDRGQPNFQLRPGDIVLVP
jgi:polysaccharide export outer membrane protein